MFRRKHHVKARVSSHVILLSTLLLLSIFLVLSLFGESLTPQDPAAQSLGSRLLPPGSETETGMHLLGTDALGRDVLSLVLAGGRSVVVPAAFAVVIATVAGTLVGMLCGYVGGRLGDLLVLLTNIQLAFPYFLLAVAIVGILGASFWLVVFVVALGSWVELSRVVYVETRRASELEYILAVRLMGGSPVRILLFHILPNVASSALVLTALSFGHAIVIISGLGFIGISPPTTFPGWGQLLSDGRGYVADAWWLTAAPGAAIFLLVFVVNVIAEAIRDLLDPNVGR